jgi:uncharacterized protein (DUF2267 family)
MAYQRAGDDFEAFLADAREALDFTTRNPTYTTVQGVLLAFRRRLRPAEVLTFAAVLPPMLRAIFVADWTAAEYRDGFTDRDQLVAEVKALRRHHNLSPDNAIDLVADVLRRHVDTGAFDAVLAALPAGAAGFWRVD